MWRAMNWKHRRGGSPATTLRRLPHWLQMQVLIYHELSKIKTHHVNKQDVRSRYEQYRLTPSDPVIRRTWVFTGDGFPDTWCRSILDPPPSLANRGFQFLRSFANIGIWFSEFVLLKFCTYGKNAWPIIAVVINVMATGGDLQLSAI
jgi:hypothetical protein